MLLEPAIVIMEKLEKELQEAEPEKREHFIKLALSLVELSTEALLKKTGK